MVFLLIFISGLTLLSGPACAQEPSPQDATPAEPGGQEVAVEEVVKLAPEIARITAFTGEVRVRNRMEWLWVTKVGHPLFSGDKVVTKRGRAEVTFEDGSVIRLGLNASVKITEKTELKGLLFRRKLTVRNVRVALGKVWFRIKSMKGKRTTMRTPTMSAGVRGTSGVLSVGPEGESEWGLIDGAADASGAYTEPESYEAPDTEVVAAKLPESDPAYEATAISRASDEAIRAREAMAKLRREAAELEDRARKLEMRASAEPTLDNRMAAIETRLRANRVRIEAAMSGVSAKGVSTREAVEEALAMREEENARRTREVVEQVEGFLNAVQAEQEKGAAAEVLTLGRSDELLLRGGITFSNSVAKTAKVCEYAAWAFSNVGNATSEGDTVTEAGALEYAGRARGFADRGQAMTSRGQDMAREVASVRESMIRRSFHAGTLPMYVAQADELEHAMVLLKALWAFDVALDFLMAASGFSAVGASGLSGGVLGVELGEIIEAVNRAADEAAGAAEDAADAALAGDMVALEAALSALESAMGDLAQLLAIAAALDDPTEVFALYRDLVQRLMADMVTVVGELGERELPDGWSERYADDLPFSELLELLERLGKKTTASPFL